MRKHPTIKVLIYIFFGIAAGLCIYSGLHLHQRIQTSQNIFLLQKESISGDQEDSLQQAVEMSNAYLAYKQGNYLQAIQYISGQEDTDYYNRGVLYIMQAYQQGMQKDFSTIESAQQEVLQAQQSFLLAGKLSTNPQVQKLAQYNGTKATQMQTIIQSKSCYMGGEESISLFSGLQSDLDQMLSTLQQEQTLFLKNRNILPEECQKQRSNLFDMNERNIPTLQDIAKTQGQQELMKLERAIDNPYLCLSGANGGLIHSLQDTQQAISTFTQQHQNNLETRKTAKNNEETLCQRDKNDGQIDQSLQSQIQNLLQEIGKNKSSIGQSTSPTYTPLDTKDQNLLENINKKNRMRIRQIQRLKTEKTYDGFPYIQSLFNSFYGNSGDFQTAQ